jgi:hypothetical protein
MSPLRTAEFAGAENGAAKMSWKTENAAPSSSYRDHTRYASAPSTADHSNAIEFSLT